VPPWNPSVNESITEVAAVSAAFSLDTVFSPPDSDGDGMRDYWEIANGLDRFRNDANEDPDGDGRTNLEEYNVGTNPHVDDWAGPSEAYSPVFVANRAGTINLSAATPTAMECRTGGKSDTRAPASPLSRFKCWCRILVTV